jgi:hypothetical protein
MTICTVPGCDRDTHARDLCAKHYQRDYRTGTPYPRPLDNGMLRIVRQLERPDREARMSVAQRSPTGPGCRQGAFGLASATSARCSVTQSSTVRRPSGIASASGQGATW